MSLTEGISLSALPDGDAEGLPPMKVNRNLQLEDPTCPIITALLCCTPQYEHHSNVRCERAGFLGRTRTWLPDAVVRVLPARLLFDRRWDRR